MQDNSRKIVLLLQNLEQQSNDEIVVHVHEQINFDGKVYVPVHSNERVTLCRIDMNNGEEFLTDDLSDYEFTHVQTIYQNHLTPTKI